jgi:hypothetical protein
MRQCARVVCLLLFFLSISFITNATTIRGLIKDTEGNRLAFATVFVKGTQKGVSANSEGFYEITLSPGDYVLVAQYIGYARKEIRVKISSQDLYQDIILKRQELVLAPVILSNKEDPAYGIIREVIASQKENLANTQRFTCQVYTKGQLRLRDFPNKFLSQKVDFEDGDTSKKKILFLSETVSVFSLEGKKNRKVEVLSSKVSGSSDGYGLAAPDQFVLYNNVVFEGTRLNPRGFVSPLSQNAFQYYRYKLLGSFEENGKTISKISVIPKRKAEPLFTGEITIVEEDDQLYAADLKLFKNQQLELLDTLRLVQMNKQDRAGTWMLSSQVLYPSLKRFGFDVYGSFINIYTDYNTTPTFAPRFFDRTILRYLDSSNKRSMADWEKIRPVPLLDDELRDYVKKDSLEKLRESPAYLDSLNKIRNKFTLPKLLLTGQTLYSKADKFQLSLNSLLEQVNFNPAEGWLLNSRLSCQRKLDSAGASRRSLSGNLTLRYGFANKHFSPSTAVVYNFGSKLRRSIGLSLGKQVFQFNAQSPITEQGNTLSSLLYEENRIKSYEAQYFRINYAAGLGAGLSVNASLQYQDRMPLDNRTNYTWVDRKDRSYTPNFPEELTATNITRHQVAQAVVSLRWQPGSRYIELPERIVNIGSNKPVLQLQFNKAFNKFLGSDAKFAKWKFEISDAFNFKLKGQLQYRAGVGGFLNKTQVPLPDLAHFNGNISPLATAYLNSFQLLPLYRFSNSESLYWLGHVEYNLRGFITNKIPLLRKTGAYLVFGLNTCYVDQTRKHFEWFFGFDNIFKQLRIDYVMARQPGQPLLTGFRLGFKGPPIR